MVIKYKWKRSFYAKLVFGAHRWDIKKSSFTTFNRGLLLNVEFIESFSTSNRNAYSLLCPRPSPLRLILTPLQGLHMQSTLELVGITLKIQLLEPYRKGVWGGGWCGALNMIINTLDNDISQYMRKARPPRWHLLQIHLDLKEPIVNFLYQ